MQRSETQGTPPPDVATPLTVADTDEESGFVVQRIPRRGGLLVATPATVPPFQGESFFDSGGRGPTQGSPSRPPFVEAFETTCIVQHAGHPTCIIHSGQPESLRGSSCVPVDRCL